MKTTRRTFLLGMAAGSAGLGAGWLGCGALQAGEANALDAARRQAAHRRRRVIFNNDGDDIWAPGADTAERFLATRHTPLVGTHVDSIYYCTTQSFNFFTHQTKVAEVFTSKGGQFANNNLAKFLEQDTDGLRMSSEFARKHSMESIWTLRMNDIHDAWTPQFRPKWKQDDPTRIMSTLEKSKNFQDRRRLWSLVDFEHPDVEPRLLEIIEEVLIRYDIDGIELDFLRAPFYFRSAYDGNAATDQQIGVLTKLMRAVRQLVLRESQRQGKPFLLAVRVPPTTALGRKIGIDMTVWLQEQLVDVVALGGGYITFDLPLKNLVNLAHRHDVPVYPCLSQSGLMYRSPRGKGTKQPPQAWLGAAARLWQDGADGIYTFNLFPGPGNEADRKYARKVLGAIGSPEQLARSPIVYAVSDAGWWMPAHYWAKDVTDFSAALPLPLSANEYERTSLFVPEDLRGAGFNVTAELRVDFTGLTAESTPEILFGSANFGPTAGGRQIADVRRYICKVPVQSIAMGANRVMVKTKESGAKLAGAELWIHR
ncbi:MAG: hypothetical protein QGH33_09550 [Pirellulaceae bacterium]|nr:hypothetical protein [Pirellulaceae bacterium]HJN07893.1 hypothetical protein [Pirellulaceae bacterium]